MKTRIKVILFSLAVLVFVSCQENNILDPKLSSDDSPSASLQKMGWNTSQEYSWSLVTEYLPEGYTVLVSAPSLSFTYMNYNFNLTFTIGTGYTYWEYRPNTIKIYTNNSLMDEDTWYTTDIGSGLKSEGWSNWINFTYNGVNMSYRYYTDIVTYEDRNYYNLKKNRIRNVQVQIYGYVNPDVPTGFSVSPIAHNNLNQAVTVSWNVSSDTDVTGYKIYRKLQTDSYYSLIQSIGSRTTSSWVDYSVPWSESSPEMTIVGYKMVAYDGTHNLTSVYTAVRTSALP